MGKLRQLWRVFSNKQSPPLFLPGKVGWTSWGAFSGPRKHSRACPDVTPPPLVPGRAASCFLKYFWRLAALPPWMRSETPHSSLQLTITLSSRPWASPTPTPTWNTGGDMKEIYIGLTYIWQKVSPARQGELCTRALKLQPEVLNQWGLWSSLPLLPQANHFSSFLCPPPFPLLLSFSLLYPRIFLLKVCLNYKNNICL